MNTLKAGHILCWIIFDPNGEMVMRCASRKEARELCAGDGKIAKVVVAA
jgi:hypothetical protein